MQVPCQNCPDRAVGCHGSCVRYRQFKAHREALLAARRKQNEKSAALFDMARHLRRRKQG